MARRGKKSKRTTTKEIDGGASGIVLSLPAAEGHTIDCDGDTCSKECTCGTCPGEPKKVTSMEEDPGDVAERLNLLGDRVSALEGRVTALEEVGRPSRLSRPRQRKDRTYTVREDDKLALIARELLGNAGRAREIAAINGLRSHYDIFEGQVLKIPPS